MKLIGIGTCLLHCTWCLSRIRFWLHFRVYGSMTHHPPMMIMELLMTCSCLICWRKFWVIKICYKKSPHQICYHGWLIVATPLWPSVGVKPNTPKVGDLESSGTPECLGFDRKAQKTFHWGVLGVIGKFLKRRYGKWPRIGHLDICNPSYG